MVVASNGALPLDRFSDLDLASEDDADEWARLAIPDAKALLTRYVGDRALWGNYFEAFPVRTNSDYHPVLGYLAPRAQFKRQQADDFIKIKASPLPISPTPITPTRIISFILFDRSAGVSDGWEFQGARRTRAGPIDTPRPMLVCSLCGYARCKTTLCGNASPAL